MHLAITSAELTIVDQAAWSLRNYAEFCEISFGHAPLYVLRRTAPVSVSGLIRAAFVAWHADGWLR